MYSHHEIMLSILIITKKLNKNEYFKHLPINSLKISEIFWKLNSVK